MSRGGKFISLWFRNVWFVNGLQKTWKKTTTLFGRHAGLLFTRWYETFPFVVLLKFFESSRNWGRKYKGQRWSLPDQILIWCFTIQQFVSAGVSHLTKSLNLISLYARLILRKLCLLWIDDNVKTTKERPLEDNSHCRDLTAWRYDKL